MRDKLLHAETSALMVIILNFILPVWFSATVTILAGIGKEIWDRKHGTCDIKDIYADIIGVIIGLIII